METSDSAVGLRFEHLGEHNYASWSVRMKAFLQLKGWWEYANPATPLTAAQQLEDAKALAALTLSVQNHNLPLIDGVNTFKEAWERLQRAHRSRGAARLMAIRRELANLQMRRDETLAKFISRARALWTELIVLGGSMDESDVAMNVLNGLPTSFSMVATVLTTTVDASALTLDMVQEKMLPVQHRSDPAVESLSTAALAANAQQSGKVCYYCGKPGHIKARCHKKARDEQKKKADAGGHSGNSNGGDAAALAAITYSSAASY